MPFPHQTIYFGEDKEGRAPPAFISIEGRKETAPVVPRARDDDDEPS